MNLRRLSLTAALVVATVASAQAGVLHGTWTASNAKERSGKLDFSLRTGHNDNSGTMLERSALAGLSEADVQSIPPVEVRFRLEREAGTVAFEGTFRNGIGAGDFTFTSDPEFRKKLRSIGVRSDDPDIDDDRDLLTLTLFDVSIPFIRSMQAIGYDESIEKYVAFRIFGVDPAYVRDMASVGFDHLSADKLVETKIHGATPEYIRAQRAAGQDLTLNQYIESRIFRITPEFAQQRATAGYPDLSREQLLQMRIFHITPEFIRRAQKAAHGPVSVNRLVEMRIFHVDPERARSEDDGDDD